MRKLWMSLLLAFLAGCAGEPAADSPRDAALAVLAHLQMGSSRVQEYLAPGETERLRDLARSRPGLRLAPADWLYLRAPWPAISGDEPKTEILSSDAASARVAVHHGKERLVMDFIRTGGRWRLKLPITVQP